MGGQSVRHRLRDGEYYPEFGYIDSAAFRYGDWYTIPYEDNDPFPYTEAEQTLIESEEDKLEAAVAAYTQAHPNPDQMTAAELAEYEAGLPISEVIQRLEEMVRDRNKASRRDLRFR